MNHPGDCESSAEKWPNKPAGRTAATRDGEWATGDVWKNTNRTNERRLERRAHGFGTARCRSASPCCVRSPRRANSPSSSPFLAWLAALTGLYQTRALAALEADDLSDGSNK